MNDRQLLTRDLLVLFGLTGWGLSLPYLGSEFMVSMGFATEDARAALLRNRNQVDAAVAELVGRR